MPLKKRDFKENEIPKLVIDTKYKDGLSDSDLYQIGFYIHEYFEESWTRDGKKLGYAILPTTENLDVKGKKSRISSLKQDIQIVKSFINIDKIVPLLDSKIPEDQEKLVSFVTNLIDNQNFSDRIMEWINYGKCPRVFIQKYEDPNMDLVKLTEVAEIIRGSNGGAQSTSGKTVKFLRVSNLKDLITIDTENLLEKNISKDKLSYHSDKLYGIYLIKVK